MMMSTCVVERQEGGPLPCVWTPPEKSNFWHLNQQQP